MSHDATAVTPPLSSTLAAEFVGTAFLVATVVGSGVMATRLSPDDTGLQLLQNCFATAAVLTALILALQPVSASFNPVVTMVDVWFGHVPIRLAALLVAAQVAGGVSGSVAANLMFDLDPITVATTDRTGANLWFAEVVATLGLVLVIFTSIRLGRSAIVAYAVGGYIAAAYWFTASTSFANPAVTIGRTVSDTFTGIAPSSAPMFIAMQVLGGVLAFMVVRLIVPRPTVEAPHV